MGRSWRAPDPDTTRMRAETLRLTDALRWHERDLVELQVETRNAASLEGRAKMLEQYNRHIEAFIHTAGIAPDQMQFINSRRQQLVGLLQQVANQRTMLHHRAIDVQMRQQRQALSRASRDQQSMDAIARQGLGANLGGPVARPGLPIGGPGIYHGETMPLAPLQATHAWSFGPEGAALGPHAAGLMRPLPTAAMQDQALADAARWKDMFARAPAI